MIPHFARKKRNTILKPLALRGDFPAAIREWCFFCFESSVALAQVGDFLGVGLGYFTV
jgi:hypothetical protein